MRSILFKEKNKDVIVPRKMLKISGLHKAEKLACIPLDGVTVLTKKSLSVQGLNRVMTSLEELLMEMDDDIDVFCGNCPNLNGDCPCGREIYE